MNLDSVSVVVRFAHVGSEEIYSDVYWKAEFLPEHVYYGSGTASDAQRAKEAAEDLNDMYKTSQRYYGAVRMDYEDVIKENLIKI